MNHDHSSDRLGVPASIVVVAHSPRWQSQIQRSLKNLEQTPKVHWLLDFESARKFIVSNECTVLIVELPDSFTEQSKATLNLVVELCNNPQQCPLFLLGDDSIDPWRAILAEAGANDTCGSILDYVKVWPRIERLLKIRPTQDLTVEETVAARLPW